MTPEQILSQVCGVPADGISDATSNSNLPEWDSLAHVILVMELEKAYGVKLSVEDALALTDMRSIKHYLNERGVSW